MTAAFTPSAVHLRTVPLTDTFGHTESEVAAALLVRVCQRRGDTWAPVSIRDVSEMFKADTAEGLQPMTSIARNPFLKPDMWELIEKGFARWTGEPGKSAIEFTELGFARLRPGRCKTCGKHPGARTHNPQEGRWQAAFHHAYVEPDAS